MAETEVKGTEVQTQATEEIKTAETSKTNEQNKIDVEKVKGDAIVEYLKELGVEDGDTLKGIVTKAKEEEEKNKTDLEKSNDTLTATTKELVAEREARIIAEAKLSAIQLGAKPELVDDLVIIAKAKVTKDKDINAIIAEIKDSTSGEVYFSNEDEEEKQKGTVTRKRVNKNPETNNQSEKDKDKDNNKAEQHKGTMAERLLANRVKPKSHYFSK